MTPIINGHCTLNRVHCAWCLTHPEWRAQVGTVSPCPEGFTEEAPPIIPDAPPPKPIGVGTHLKRILAGWGITDTKDCGCAALEAEMNRLGPDGCEADMPRLVQALTDKSEKRNWLKFAPFKAQGAEFFVRKAIEQARALPAL